MEKIYLYNTLTRKKELFKPIKPGIVGMYSCGPTVYNYAHIGNFRTNIFNDILKRMLTHNKLKVKHVMNITDIDDKTIKGSQQEKLLLHQFTRKYEKIFLDEIASLNIIKPAIILRAAESIPQIIELIEILLKKKYAYRAEEGIYFSIDKFKAYAKLAQLEKTKKKKERILADEYDKNNPQDFALWKFYVPEDGNVVWDAPFGRGRPGWHIECSAMSINALGEHFDIHTGGSDLIFPHHTNEIAQSEAATGKKFVNYWIHGGMLIMKEGKMSKSLGNVYALRDLQQQGYRPLHYRYLCLLTHYRKPLTFTIENLNAAKISYEKIKRRIIELRKEKHTGADKFKEYESLFNKAIYNDLNIPRAIQIFLEALNDIAFDTKKKLSLLENFDSVLGLCVSGMKEEKIIIPDEVQKLIDSRERLRKAKLWTEADIIRQRIKELGYLIQDNSDGLKIEKIN
ncbi:MAG: cysteine--tRNA ligase [Nanoarchaeota archaeon]